MKSEKEEKSIDAKPFSSKLIAKKDFTFHYNKKTYEIKKGDEVDVPKMFMQNLKTEKVI